MSQNITWEQAVAWLRAQPDQQELVQACYYDDPLLEAAKRFAASIEWRATLRLLPERAGTALDFGAGRGISSYALAAGGWQVTALEPDPSELVGAGAIRALASEAKMPVTVVQGFAEEMEFDGMFDLVYTREVLHHARDLREMCRQAARALKPGGMFLACREHVISRKEDVETFRNNHPLHRLYGGENAYLEEEYLSAISKSGLKLQKAYGPFETIINYFPETEEQRLTTIQAPLRKRFGNKMTDLFGNPRHPWAQMVNGALAWLMSRRTNTPGRLYTFAAYKPE
jgi:SAM-dependent methyltransferase